MFSPRLLRRQIKTNWIRRCHPPTPSTTVQCDHHQATTDKQDHFATVIQFPTTHLFPVAFRQLLDTLYGLAHKFSHLSKWAEIRRTIYIEEGAFCRPLFARSTNGSTIA